MRRMGWISAVFAGVALASFGREGATGVLFLAEDAAVERTFEELDCVGEGVSPLIFVFCCGGDGFGLILSHAKEATY